METVSWDALETNRHFGETSQSTPQLLHEDGVEKSRCGTITGRDLKEVARRYDRWQVPTVANCPKIGIGARKKSNRPIFVRAF